MARKMRALVGAATAAALLLGATAPAHAGTASGVTEGWAIDVHIPDVTWNKVDSCEDIPIEFAVDGWGAERWLVDMDVRHVQAGSDSSWIYDFGYATPPDDVNGTWTSSFQLCSYDTPPGTYEVQGIAEYGYAFDYDTYGMPGVLQIPISTTFTVSKMMSTTSLDPIVSNGNEARISGRVTAQSPLLGSVGVGSKAVSVQRLVNGGWLHITTLYTDPLGYFTSTFTGVSTPTPFRAVFGGTEKVAESESAGVTPQLPPPPPPPDSDADGVTDAQDACPTSAGPASNAGCPVPPPAPTVAVAVKAVDRGNKLYVNVNPNKGSGYWRFKVQKRTSTGAWRTLTTTYKTYGKGETRTLNLPKGTYRVVVKAKYGYLGTTSAQVRLKR